MRKRRGWLWVVVAATILIPHAVHAVIVESPHINAKAALVMDGVTGAILWARNADLMLPPASTTKVMTAVLALESGDLERAFPASVQACTVSPTKVFLRPGQRFSLEDLVYAILLNSANDASLVIAESLAGSEEHFAERMTARARQLGALNTRFVNPHGLTAEGHYSTARDLATIFRHALTVPRFREIAGTKSITIGVENGSRKIALRSHNRLLGSYRVPVVGKTGYTIAAKKCFVGAGAHGDREIIVSVLGSTDLWGDTKRLLEFGFGDSLPAEPVLQRAKPEPVKKRGKGRGKVRTVTRSQRYAIQVGTFDRIDQAKRLQRALGKRGYMASIDRVTVGRGTKRKAKYRVQVGSYADRGRAESAVRTMSAQVALPARIIQR